MARTITTLPNHVLRKKSEPVSTSEFGSKSLQNILRDMSAALRSTSDGIGIAAPQIGVSKRIFIASEEALAIDKVDDAAEENTDTKQKKKHEWKHFIFINPEIIKISSKITRASEGCLSVPKKYGIVPRADKIRVRARDEHGKPFERGASKLFARLLQHELDHLDGKLFIDTAEKLVTLEKK
jgi:peptide deformylase